MRKALEHFEKCAKMSAKSILAGKSYRMTVSLGRTTIGSMTFLLNGRNMMANTILPGLLNGQFNLKKSTPTQLNFTGDFTSLNLTDEAVPYYPETGLLVYDCPSQKLVLHLARSSEQSIGVVLGDVISKQSMEVAQQLRAEAECSVNLENNASFILRRTFCMSIVLSGLLLFNGLSYDPTYETQWFVRNEDDYNNVFNNK